MMDKMTNTSSELLTAETDGEVPVLLTDTVISDTVLSKHEPKRTTSDSGSQFLTQFESGRRTLNFSLEEA